MIAKDCGRDPSSHRIKLFSFPLSARGLDTEYQDAWGKTGALRVTRRAWE
jgi:hypothetical protein